MNKLWLLFITFVKVNLLTTSGPASAGLLYSEAVGRLMTHEEFVEAVGYSSVLPGSDAVQFAVFVGYQVGGLPGALVACLGAILPPTVIVMALAVLLTRLRGETWFEGFVKGLAPALAALLLVTAFNIVGKGEWQDWRPLTIGAITLVAIVLLKLPPPLVLLAAGIVGIFLFR